MRVHHLALRTNDVPRLERFYTEIFGFPVARRDELRAVWLDAGATLLMLEQKDEHEPDVPRGTGELVAFAIEPDERASYTARLAKAGVVVEARTAFTLYFRDPDGRRVGVSSYPSPSSPASD